MSEEPPISRLIPGEAEELSGTFDSMPSFAIGELDSEQGVVLKDWSAQDFANIYVRFRPHLVSHARKLLREESQAEEVVQDAFLYLMTALPELDSELGVLRFLKWKTKMLCLDILRSSTSGLNANLVPLPDEVAEESQVEASLERADDAAIIRMALAKLNPRHREALIATLYEEKSSEQVASELGIGENALRQLLFRARASFKKALVGEAEIEGKSISEILSVAARKASVVSRTSLVALVTFLLAGVSLGTVGTDNDSPGLVAGPTNFFGDSFSANNTRLESLKPETEVQTSTTEAQSPKLESRRSPAIDDPIGLEGADSLRVISPDESPEAVDVSSHVVHANSLLDSNLLSRLTANSVVSSTAEEAEGSTLLTASTSEGLEATLAIGNLAQDEIQFAWMNLRLDEHRLAVVPQEMRLLKSVRLSSERCNEYLLEDFAVGDLGGTLGAIATKVSSLSSNAALLTVCWPDGEPPVVKGLIFSNRM